MERTNTRDEALDFIEKHFADKDARWSLEVKVKGRWVCQKCGKGVFDRQILESHHIQPKEKFPHLRNDLDNGECVCLWRHAWLHKDNPIVMNMILLRLVAILTKRLYRKFSKCQRALLGDEKKAKKETFDSAEAVL